MNTSPIESARAAAAIAADEVRTAEATLNDHKRALRAARSAVDEVTNIDEAAEAIRKHEIAVELAERKVGLAKRKAEAAAVALLDAEIEDNRDRAAALEAERETTVAGLLRIIGPHFDNPAAVVEQARDVRRIDEALYGLCQQRQSLEIRQSHARAATATTAKEG